MSGHGARETFIDTHAHLTFPAFDDDRDEVVRRAHAAGVDCVITVGSGQGITGNDAAVELASRESRIFAAVGIHPHDAKQCGADNLCRLAQLLSHERVVAVGETGLDFHYRHSSPEDQRACFRSQLELAQRHDKPVVIHDREAHDDVWSVIEEVGMPRRGGVFHCFSGDAGFARKAVEQGFFISFSGIVTFPNAHALRGAAAAVPLERMLIETDCPYLSPQAYRGKRNEPAYVVHTARAIADVKDIGLHDVARVTSLNARRLFNLPGAENESS